MCVSCDCSQSGVECTSSCSCGNVCSNPFGDLSTFFGPSGKFDTECRAGPCFATWLTNQPNISELDLDLMVDMLLTDDKSWAEKCAESEALRLWQDDWNKACQSRGKGGKDVREKLEYGLLRGALGNTGPQYFYGFQYCFCQMTWVVANRWYHCPECRICRSGAEWHCHHHKQCSKAGVCSGCAMSQPVTLPYYPQEPRRKQKPKREQEQGQEHGQELELE